MGGNSGRKRKPARSGSSLGKRRATTKTSGTRKTTRAKKGTLERAMGIAYEVHATQVDKNGEPYFLHPVRVMLSNPAWGLEERIVAVLHDVVEDSPEWTCDRLRKEGFSKDVVEAIDSVTRRSEERSGADASPQDEEEKYLEFVRRAAQNPIGLSVKLADLRDNCDPRRMLIRYTHLRAEDLVERLG